MNPVLTETRRNGHIETQNRGAICVVGPDGEVLLAIGDTEAKTYPRSAMKMVQVLPVLRAGVAEAYGLDDAEVAIMCGSHNAEDIHLRVVSGILAKAQIPASAFACGPHEPLGIAARNASILSGQAPTDLHNNCSGKHAGFLALAKHIGAPLTGYLLPGHPVQRAVLAAVCEMFEVQEHELWHGIDGCSAPNYGMPLRNMALGYKNLCKQAALGESSCAHVLRAVMTHPHMVGGLGRYCTDLMNAAKGKLLAKLGADGVYCIGIPDRQIGIAIKVDDGATGPQYNVAQAILESIGVLSPDEAARLKSYLESPVINCMGIHTGSRKVEESVLKAFKEAFA